MSRVSSPPLCECSSPSADLVVNSSVIPWSLSKCPIKRPFSRTCASEELTKLSVNLDPKISLSQNINFLENVRAVLDELPEAVNLEEIQFLIRTRNAINHTTHTE